MEHLGLDFLNSDWHDYRGSGRREDRLGDEGWVRQLLERWKIHPGTQPTAKDLDALRALRQTMRRIVEAVADARVPRSEDVEALNAAIAASPYRRRLVQTGDTFEVEDEALARDWAWVRAEIALSLARVLAHRDPERVKICENPDCRWVFFDASKSRTRRWCDESCGNLLKVRRFRERKRRSRA